jgi:hypothetical protein
MTGSEFYMWRALFAFAVVDRVLTLEKRCIFARFLEDTVFTPSQTAILTRDAKSPKDVEWLFVRITAPEYRDKFCMLARKLVCYQGEATGQAEQLLQHLSHLADKNGRQDRGSFCALQIEYNVYRQTGVPGLFHHARARRMEIVA